MRIKGGKYLRQHFRAAFPESKWKMPAGRRIDRKQLREGLNAMLQLLDWQRQVVCSMLDSLGAAPAGEESAARHAAKRKARRKG